MNQDDSLPHEQEVLVTRQTRRASRLLFAVLLVSVSLGGLSYIHKMNQGAARANASAAPSMPSMAGDSQGLASAGQAAAQAADKQADPSSTQQSAIDVAGSNAPTTMPSGTTDLGAGDIKSSQARQAAESLEAPTTAPSLASTSLISQAQALMDEGRLLEARGQLNDALAAGNLDSDQADQVKALMCQISQTVVFSHKRFPDDIYGGTYVVQPGDSLAKIANVHDCTWELLSRINGIDPRHLRSGATIKVVQGPFFGYVDKKKFTFDIYLGGLPGEKSAMFVTTVKVGLGRDDSTPVGTWMIEPHRKLKHPTYYSPRGEGVIAADDPQNPLGGYWIGLTGTQGQAVGKMSYGIHGTIDPTSIGKQSSMGCIRLKADDIALVYDLMAEGKSMVVVAE
jgi:lipoprotein-anchoring transpeptidase ErfK/SrfK